MTTTTHLFTVTGMHCASCGLLIDDALEDLPGVRSSHTSIKTGVATVSIDPDLVSPAEIAETIRDTGYTATW